VFALLIRGVTPLGEGTSKPSVLFRVTFPYWRIAVHRVDISDDRRTAESVLSIQAHEIPDVLAALAKSKRLSIVVGNLNRLAQHATDHDLGRRALRHLGFLDD